MIIEGKMKYKVVGFVFLMLLIFFRVSKSQEMLGVTLGNYSGVNSILVNPAMIANTKYYIDINVASADFFFRNNFAYIPASDASIYDVIWNSENLPTYGPPNDLNFTYYDNKKLKLATVSSKILGPSAMLQLGKHSFALSTYAQFLTTANRIPYEMPLLGYYGVDEPALQYINYIDYDISGVSAAWMSLGLSYAYTLYEKYDQKITLGATLKYLWGYAGIYVESSNADYIFWNDTLPSGDVVRTMNIKNLNATAGYSLPINYSNSDELMNDPLFKGRGFGGDIGVVYKKKKGVDNESWNKLCSQEFDEYVYRIGISILDIGSLTYKSNAEKHEYIDVSKYWEDYDTTSFTNVNDLTSQLSSLFYGDPNASYAGNKIIIGLPTAVSVQADYNIYKNFYAAGYWIQPIRFNMRTLRRPAQIAIVPRYESKYFEINLPISVYEYRYPRVGLSARFWFFTIGTERIGTWLGLANLDGLDIYASIKFGFGKGNCRNRFKSACIDDAGKRKKNKNNYNKNIVF